MTAGARVVIGSGLAPTVVAAEFLFGADLTDAGLMRAFLQRIDLHDRTPCLGMSFLIHGH
jgi:hypothetical protein